MQILDALSFTRLPLAPITMVIDLTRHYPAIRITTLTIKSEEIR